MRLALDILLPKWNYPAVANAQGRERMGVLGPKQFPNLSTPLNTVLTKSGRAHRDFSDWMTPSGRARWFLGPCRGAEGLGLRAGYRAGQGVVVNVIDQACQTGRKVADCFRRSMRLALEIFLPKWNYPAVANAQDRELLGVLGPKRFQTSLLP
jgi:hypothetical protein